MNEPAQEVGDSAQRSFTYVLTVEEWMEAFDRKPPSAKRSYSPALMILGATLARSSVAVFLLAGRDHQKQQTLLVSLGVTVPLLIVGLSLWKFEGRRSMRFSVVSFERGDASASTEQTFTFDDRGWTQRSADGLEDARSFLHLRRAIENRRTIVLRTTTVNAIPKRIFDQAPGALDQLRRKCGLLVADDSRWRAGSRILPALRRKAFDESGIKDLRAFLREPVSFSLQDVGWKVVRSDGSVEVRTPARLLVYSQVSDTVLLLTDVLQFLPRQSLSAEHLGKLRGLCKVPDGVSRRTPSLMDRWIEVVELNVLTSPFYLALMIGLPFLILSFGFADTTVDPRTGLDVAHFHVARTIAIGVCWYGAFLAASNLSGNTNLPGASAQLNYRRGLSSEDKLVGMVRGVASYHRSPRNRLPFLLSV